MNGKITKLTKCITTFLNGECTEEEIDKGARDLGYKHPNDYLTVDKSCRYLGVCRDTFYRLVKRYNIKDETFNTIKVGYYKPYLRKIKDDLKKRT